MSVTKESLDNIAQSYYEVEAPDMFIEDTLQRYCLKWIMNEIGPHKNILELGYGAGIVTECLLNNNKQVTLIEGSAILIRQVQEKYANRLQCVHSLFEDFEPKEKYDVILASHVLEHIDEPAALLSKMKNCIKPDGKIIIIVPNSESVHRRLGLIMNLQPTLDTLSARDKIVGHQRVYSCDTLIEDIEKANLKVLTKRGLGFKSVSNSMMLDYSHDLLNALNVLSEFMPIEYSSNLGFVVQ